MSEPLFAILMFVVWASLSIAFCEATRWFFDPFYKHFDEMERLIKQRWEREDRAKSKNEHQDGK